MTIKERITQFVSMNESTSNRFKHFISKAVGLPSEIKSAILLSDGSILIMKNNDCGYDDFTGWDIPSLNDNLNKLADALQLSHSEKIKFFDACVKVFEFGSMTAGEVPILIPEQTTE